MSWRGPRVHPVHLGEMDPHLRSTSWLALFSDLVFVAVLVQLGTILSDDVSWLGFAETAALFFPVWWAWVGLTFFSNRYEVDDVVHRLLVGAQMLGLVVMALAAPRALGDGAAAFTLGYVTTRVALVAINARAAPNAPPGATRDATRTFVRTFGAATLVWAAAAFVDDPGRWWVWALALALDLVLPFTGGAGWLEDISEADYEHLADRFGEFTIIALGESFLKVVIELAGVAVTWSVVGHLALAVVAIASLWWVYFDDVAGARLRAGGNGWITVVQYGHYVLVLGIVATAVATQKVVELGVDGSFDPSYAWLLAGSAALALTAVAVLDEATDSERDVPRARRARMRLVPAVAVLVVAAVTTTTNRSATTIVVAITATLALAPTLDALDRTVHAGAGRAD